MKHPAYIIIGVALCWLFAACGRQQEAKTIVKDFMGAHVANYDKVSYVKFYDVDSTRTISDSLIQVLRQRTPAHFSRPISYQQRSGKTLWLIRTRYLMGQDTCSATFYIDKDMTGVVAFKEN
jgi:hypothetical protein